MASIKCIVTGAGGFVGQALASALLENDSISKLVLTDVFEPPLPTTKDAPYTEVVSVKADLTSPSTCSSLFTPNLDCIYLLHGIMSAQAEADLELGLKVNLDSTRQIFDHLRATNPGVKIIFTSSTAVYGPPPTPGFVFTEMTAPDPESSYGAQKHICETLLNDYSRRGLMDARICRLPTVVVRPGKPTGAASSFASGIFREPLNGEKGVLPVASNLDLWICSPRTVVKNLMLAMNIPKDRFSGSRIVNLPGITVSVEEMLNALKEVGGVRAFELVEEKRDEGIEKIVKGWPTRLDTSKAKSLGYTDDGPLVQTLHPASYNINPPPARPQSRFVETYQILGHNNMADYNFAGSDEENAELKKLNAEVLEDPDSFDNWEKLVRAAEGLEGGLNRNSSPQSIVIARDIYDRFLAKFPLLFGYWKKYADLEFSIAGTEAAELVYERGVASITNSVDLWTNYCAFKVETSHDPDVIRE
ncbi:MAG: hypothetical protein Q9217_004837 [Psora testacea]